MDSNENGQQFSDFLLREYDNIASAYFNIKNSISLFFRYYILIASVPITVFVLLLSKKGTELTELLSQANLLFSGVCLLISLVGFGLMMYVLSMNFTATLYARQVNGIRHYYYSKVVEHVSVDKVCVLPTDNSKPVYSLWRSVKYLLLVLCAINAFYFSVAIQMIDGIGVNRFVFNWFSVFALQILVCWFRAYRRSVNDQ